MSTTLEQINLWRSASSEHQRLEFKEAKTQFDFGKLCKYCVALANEGGGQMLLGIADKPPRPVVGTTAVNDPVGMAGKLFQTLGFRVDVEAVNHPDGRVVVFHIPSRPQRGKERGLESAGTSLGRLTFGLAGALLHRTVLRDKSRAPPAWHGLSSGWHLPHARGRRTRSHERRSIAPHLRRR